MEFTCLSFGSTLVGKNNESALRRVNQIRSNDGKSVQWTELGEPSTEGSVWLAEVEGDDRVFRQRLEMRGARLASAGQEAGAALWGRRSLRIELEGEDVPRQVYAAAIDSGVRVRRLSRDRESLETVFHRLLDHREETR